MLWSVIYNSALAVWGSKLKGDAEVAWADDFAEDYNGAEDISKDTSAMFTNTEDGDPAADGSYCEITKYTSFWRSFY